MDRVVTLGNNALTLDFTGLFSTDQPEKQLSKTGYNELLSGGEYKTLDAQEKPATELITGLNGEQAIQLQREHDKAEQDHQRSIEVYRTYQENIKASSQLQSELLKGVKAGEDIYSLFLKAAKAISCMTSNTAFYNQLEADIVAIYGAGLLEKAPLQRELQDTQTRLERLLEAEGREQAPDSKSRIQAAIKAHRARVAELENLIQ